MNSPQIQILQKTPKGPLRFREGGWLILVMFIMIIALLAWALAGPLLQITNRPPGDGETLESYAFDLSQPRIPLEAIEPAMLYRDMPPVLDDPMILDPESVRQLNEARKPYLVPDDLVIGIELGGVSRAYPLLLLNVHEIINDEMEDVPLAVMWHWPSGTATVFDRRIADENMSFGFSSLVGHGNMLFYPRNQSGETGGEPLLSQGLGQSVTGPELTLTSIPHDVVRWGDWLERHPETTVVAAVPELKQRYKKGKPDTWFASSGLMFSVPPPNFGPRPKAPVLLAKGKHSSLVIPIEEMALEAGEDGHLTIELDGEQLEMEFTQNPYTARVKDLPDGFQAQRMLWITAHAMHPEADLLVPETGFAPNQP
ncbi:MAG: hypothetical protein CMJ39_03070 [Phycisphaerae bacterium]|nr:hypothetical protein [Phycisphaerae bacterium]